MIRLRYYGNFGDVSGYSLAAYDYLTALLKLGHEVEAIVNVGAKLDRIPARHRHLLDHATPIEQAKFYTRLSGMPTHIMIHVVPYQFENWAAQLPITAPLVAMTTWETSKFPSEATRQLRQASKVIVPCDWNVQAMKAAGLEATTLPHCFDPSWWFIDRPMQLGDEPFTFYTILTWCERKNPIGVLKAYLSEFTSDDKVLLKVVTPVYNKDEVGGLVRALGKDHLPPVQYLGCAPNRLTDTELRELHLTSDCYVTLARGEGWGLGAFEAMLVGNPVIAPRYGGFLDFLSDYVGRLWIDCFETPALTPPTQSPTAITVGNMVIRPVQILAPDGITGDQHWAEPDLKQCMDAMREVYELGKGLSQCRSAIVQAELTARFSYETVGKKLVEILEA